MKYLKYSTLVLLVAASVSFFPSAVGNKYVFLKGSLSGVVFNEAGQTIPQAGIMVKGANYENDLKTDGQGRFNIRKLPTGVYQLILKTTDQVFATQKEAAIHLGKETYVSLVVKSGPKPDKPAVLEPIAFRDSEGRIIHQETLIGNRAYSIDCVYDAKGRVTFIRDGANQEWNYEYSASGKIRKVTRPDGKTIFYNYDGDDQLVKIDLPWGYKIFYEKKGNQFVKSVTKYKNQILYQFAYTLDSKGNKIIAEEGTGRKAAFGYSYDGNDRLREIRNRLTGEANQDVVEYKGKVKNGAVDGKISVKNGKYQDLHYEYSFDGRGNIVRQKELRGDMEVQRKYSQRDTLNREVYLHESSPVYDIAYEYDAADRLVVKTINSRIRYEYYRDPEGHVLRKDARDLVTGETKSGIIYSPFQSDIDQDGFELIKYDQGEKLIVRDAEGNARFAVDIGDVMKHHITTLDRQVNMDGDYWGSPESLLGLIESKMRNPVERTGKYYASFYDLPLADSDVFAVEFSSPNPSIENQTLSSATLSNWPGMSIGCYGFQMNSPMVTTRPLRISDEECNYGWFDYCVDCYDGYLGEDLGGYGCSGWISGPGELDPSMEGIFSLETDCYSPYGMDWFGQNATVFNYGNWCSASWDDQSGGQYKELGVTYWTSNEYSFTDSHGAGFEYAGDVQREAHCIVFVRDPPQPDVYSINIRNYTTTGENNSFIHGDIIHVYGEAYRNGQDISANITWRVEGFGYYSGGGIPSEGSGASFSFTPNPFAVSSEGRTEPLSYTVTACLPEGGSIEAPINITQDSLDQLRQEYMDFYAPVPWRSSFDTYGSYHWKLLDPPDIDYGRHEPFHMVMSINSAVASTEYNYGAPVNITSGYRCPAGNFRANGTYDSKHLYGWAFDYVHPPQSAFVAIASAARFANLRVLLHVTGEPAGLYHEYNPPNQPAPANIDRGHIEL